MDEERNVRTVFADGMVLEYKLAFLLFATGLGFFVAAAFFFALIQFHWFLMIPMAGGLVYFTYDLYYYFQFSARAHAHVHVPCASASLRRRRKRSRSPQPSHRATRAKSGRAPQPSQRH